MEKNKIVHTSLFILSKEFSQNQVLSVTDGETNILENEKKLLEEENQQQKATETQQNKISFNDSKSMVCNSCKITLDKEKKEHVSHYSSDFHRLNVKLRSIGIKRIMTEEEYNILGLFFIGLNFCFFYFFSYFSFNHKNSFFFLTELMH